MSPTRLRVLAVSGLLLVTAACSDAGSGKPETDPTPTASSTSPPPSEPPGATLPDEVAVLDAGGESIPAAPFADFMVAAGDEVWVSGVEPGVVAYDAATGAITHRVPFESDVVQAMDSNAVLVYAAGADPDLLLTIDPDTGREVSRVPLPGAPLPESSVAAFRRGTVCVLVEGEGGAPQLVVVEGGKVTRTVPAPEGSLAVRYGFDSLWVTVSGGELLRLASIDGQAEQAYEVGLGARFLTIGEDAVWTLDAADGTVTRVDPETGDVDTVLVSEFPIEGGDIAADLGAVWARTSTGVTRVDPSTLLVTDRVAISPGSGSVAAAAGWMWTSDHDHNAVHRVPLTGLTGG